MANSLDVLAAYHNAIAALLELRNTADDYGPCCEGSRAKDALAALGVKVPSAVDDELSTPLVHDGFGNG